MARYELHYAGTPDRDGINPFLGTAQTFAGKRGWTKSFVVSQSGSVALFLWGKSPRVGARSFASAAIAREYITRIVAAHVAAGYALVSEEEIDPRSAPPAREPLAARMAAGDDDAYLVYADQLAARGDPRGELIVLQASDDPRAAEKQAILLDAHQTALAGPLAWRLESSHVEWRLGFVDHLRVGFAFGDPTTFSAAESLAEIFAHPCASLLRSLTVGLPSDPNEGAADYDAVLGVIGTAAPETLRRLHVGDFESPDEIAIGRVSLGDASALWLGLPDLEELTLHGCHLTLGLDRAPRLKSLTIRSGGGSARGGADVTAGDLDAILSGERLPSLVDLTLRGAPDTDAICDRLARSTLLSRLRVLDLASGTMTDEGAAHLLAAAPRLERLDVSGNRLSAEARERLAPLAADVKAGDQRSTDEEGRADDAYDDDLYDSVSE
jgi:uncharacterized protein (TIGR02996 family)